MEHMPIASAATANYCKKVVFVQKVLAYPATDSHLPQTYLQSKLPVTSQELIKGRTVHFEKLTAPQLVKKFPTSYSTQKVNTVLITACHLSLS
jgi:hypothetical protein